MNREYIDHYASGPEKVRLAVRGLTAEDLMTRPDPGAKIGLWSIHEVIMHLSDCEQVYADRMKRIIAEENPTLQDFDENLWAKKLQYDAQSTEDAITLLELARRQMSRIFARVPTVTFDRVGTHTQDGEQKLFELVAKINLHLDHHLKFVHQKRAAMGKEMW